MPKYSVEITMQAPGQEPSTMKYLREGTGANAVTAVSSVIAQFEEQAEYPEFAPVLLSVTVTKEA